MNIRNIQIKPDRRHTAERLEEILTKLPIEVSGTDLQLRARMGLGRVILIEPAKGYISSIRFETMLKPIEMEVRKGIGQCLIFNYGRLTFEIRYNT